MKRTNSVLTLCNGRGIDLLAPKSSDIDFEVIAEHLAKENRYNGATSGKVYSVAEHTVRGVHAILKETRDRELAAYFLLHDAPEAYLGDDTTPKKRAIGIIAEEAFGILASSISDAYDRLTDRFDVAIHEAAGLAWPPRPEIRAGVKYWDLVMFVTEWRDLMGGQPHPDPTAYQGIPALSDKISPWVSWWSVKAFFHRRCMDLLPSLQGSGGGA